ncbi:MAG: alpha/beta hydrolase [Cytophagales bacterium]|nr:alpha/beta hydrolase [Cytophagales bacterium]
MSNMKYLYLLALLSSCIEFRISEKDALVELGGLPIIPFFHSIEVGDRTISYVTTDQKKDTLVAFMHGSPGSWNAFIDFFKNDSLLRVADIISIDRPGFGDSDHGIPEPSLEKQAMQMHAVLNQFEHTTKILVGHSLGGSVIARMGMDYPTAYDRLVMVAPSVDPDLEEYVWYMGMEKNVLGKALTPTDMWVSNEEIFLLKGELRKMLELWKNIEAKVVVIQGSSDSLVPKENADLIEKMVADSLLDIRLLIDVDHFIPWSHPHEIVRGILE